ncbi:GNAT family N-acetyltransferase [Microlunatus soli]|uniref:Predicted acetyltransferase n=1 Tax=Microlunatus soli TaxID=630515 RepID=A0A1H1QCF5_9ACTN|nr:GNAT family N-acetyltransferase [Microlunatus soli]SDS21172.1 Predicted acetyltransferase [Microlunatus soli]
MTEAPGSVGGHVPPHRSDLVLSDLSSDGLEDYFRVVVRGFHGEYNAEDMEPFLALIDPDRAFGFRAGDRWVTTTLSLPRTMSVPGGSIPIAAVTDVTVAPAFRRRGLLTKMMRHQLSGLAEPVSVLWATESLIYGRFGYGQLSRRLSLSGLTREMDFLPEVDLGSGSTDEVDQQTFLAAAPALREAITAGRPGLMSRDDRWWRDVLNDPERHRGGAGPLRFALHFADDGRPDGFASFRVKRESSQTDLGREVIINELEGDNPQAYAALWRWLLDLDLVRAFSKGSAPVDEPLLHLVRNPRMIKAELTDGAYARINDVPAALQARRYAADVDLVLQVVDDFLTDRGGVFRLAGGADGATVTPTDRSPDLTVTSRQLASLYLGAVPARELAAAGVLGDHDPAVIGRFDRAFGTERAAYCHDFF